jgi:hypothetical protein
MSPDPTTGEIHLGIYEALSAEFPEVFKDVRGGIELSYITGEQCVSRLNETLGVFGWSFDVIEHGFNQEADEIWAKGQLTVYEQTAEGFAGRKVTRTQFGSQKVKRSRTTDSPLDIGFDLKGATTDALKKCASLVGVGLYLSKKEHPAAREERAQPSSNGQATSSGGANAAETYTCEVCDEELKEVKFRDGTVWTTSLLASYGTRKHGKVLCMQHYREANEAKKKAESQRPAVNMDEVF